MQHKITKPSRLLNQCGELIQKGYSTHPLLKFCRKDVACKKRLKEWDYYLINNDTYAVAITVGKNTPLVLISASLIDLKNKKEISRSSVKIASDKLLSMPESSKTGDIVYHCGETKVSLRICDPNREVSLSMKKSIGGQELDISLMLFCEPEDSMVIATPFTEGKELFYYNRKIIGMRAVGIARFGNWKVRFDPSNSFGLLDWGRGVWPYHTTWYWGAAQGNVHGNIFGFNLGYGFGDTTAATENMLFLNGVASKLHTVTFHIPKNKNGKFEYDKPWRITSSDGRFEMEFHPIFDRSLKLSVLVLLTNQHQVFGTFTGTAELDDGTIVYLKDFLGFAERVENRW